MLENLEDSRGCNSLISLDFAKAFNRLDHLHILRSYARLGASTEVIRLLAGFLGGRIMRVKVGSTLSSPRMINGGAPQGSCAGVQMYTVGTDDVGDGLVWVEQQQDLGWSTVEHNPRALSSSPSTDSGSLPREPSSRGLSLIHI